MKISRAGFVKEVDHTADLAIKIQAAGLPELFKLGVKGMYLLMGVMESRNAMGWMNIKISASDLEVLLVDFLSKVLNLMELEKIRLDIEEIDISGNQLEVRCQKYGDNSYSKAIKAVTYHDLKIEKRNGLWQATVTFDV